MMNRNQETTQNTCAIWQGQLEQSEGLRFLNGFYAELLRPGLGIRILDVGVGIGNICAHLLDSSEAYFGIDNVPEHIDFALKRFKGKPFEGFVVDVERKEGLEFLRQKNFDSIVSVNCFEHLRDDLAVWSALREVSRQGTKFAFLVPAHSRLYGVMDVQAGHFRRYDQKRTMARLGQSGFRVEGIRHFNLIGALVWFIAGRVSLRATAEHPSPHDLNGRWQFMYRAARLAQHPLEIYFRLEKILRVPMGLSLVVWGHLE
jgi:SAM-dependent methyltransferase